MMKKRHIVLGLSLCMAVALTGCGKNKTDPDVDAALASIASGSDATETASTKNIAVSTETLNMLTETKESFMNLLSGDITYESKIVASVAETNIAGYTFPQRGNVTYKPLDHDDISVPVPDRWKGASEFDAEGLTFCHPAGISLAFDTIEHCEAGFEQMISEAYPELVNNGQAVDEQNADVQDHNDNDEECL